MPEIVILHFSPIELYPPVLNLIRELEGKENSKVFILTTSDYCRNFRNVESSVSTISIKRMGKSGKNMPSFQRIVNYFFFYTLSFLFLAKIRPGKVLYFETISSLPAYLYRRYLNTKSNIYIHYHEYMSPMEYKHGMRLLRYFHQKEKWLYPRASWVSHTNSDRMDLFENDIKDVVLSRPHVLPNYPPRKWSRIPEPAFGFPLKIVYVGALSLQSMYTREFAEWVQSLNGRVTWDIYSHNYTPDAKLYIENLRSDWITMKDGIDYELLPDKLKNYHIGIILYTGHIPNYVYNIPNKLFEYHVCGLDVWFPDIMKTSFSYATKSSFPKIIPLDFTRLSEVNLNQIIDRSHLVLQQYPFYSELALKELLLSLSDK